MATKSAPTVGALTVTKNLVSLGLVDVSDDIYSEAVDIDGGGLTDMADIEAFVLAYQAATNASIYKVVQTVEWEGTRDPTLATSAYRAQVESGINELFKYLADNKVYTGRLVAPVAALMSGNTDTVLNVAPFPALLSAYMTLLNAQGASFDIQSLQYTTRRERKNNKRTPA